MKTVNHQYFSKLNKETIINIIQNNKIGFVSYGISGDVNGNKIKLKYRSMNRNSWNPVFYGLISEEENRVAITGSFQVNSFIKIFT